MDSRIQSYLRKAVSQPRDTEQIGPFRASFSRHSTNPFLNYASSTAGARVAMYSRRGFSPRLS